LLIDGGRTSDDIEAREESERKKLLEKRLLKGRRGVPDESSEMLGMLV
jgi:hypothetical protein